MRRSRPSPTSRRRPRRSSSSSSRTRIGIGGSSKADHRTLPPGPLVRHVPRPDTGPPMSDSVWPEGTRAGFALTFDVDAESAILAVDPAYARRLTTMSHQAYGPKVGVPRILRMLDRQGLRATFFVPGLTADRYPQTVAAIAEAGHEIGHHGYSHTPLYRLDEAGERRELERALASLERLTGQRPAGYRAPWWELNDRTPALLAEYGFRFDSSLMDD